MLPYHFFNPLLLLLTPQAERSEKQRRLQLLDVQVSDKEARLQRVVSDLKSLEDQIRQADFAAKARRDAAEREFRERTEALEEVRISSSLPPLYSFIFLSEEGPI